MFETVIEVILHQSREQVLYFYSTLKYCRYGVKHYPINQSIYLSFLPRQQNKADLFPLKVTKYVGL